MLVSIVKDWDQPDFFRQTPGGKGIWESVAFAEGGVFNCDVLVVLNAARRNIYTFCRKDGRWMMSQEPPHESYLWQTKAFPYFSRIYSFWDKEQFPKQNIIHSQTSLPWQIGKTYDELVTMTSHDHFQKKDEVSWIMSNLNSRPGHSIRLEFMDFLHRRKFPFHLFGRGFRPIEDKFDAIFPYKYSIAIENFSCNDYWTEKIADCYLSWTIPIYYGCQNITEYFPEESMIRIDPRKPEEALLTIQDALESNKWKTSLSFIAEARELILNKYQFFPSIVEKIKERSLGKKRFYFIKKIG